MKTNKNYSWQICLCFLAAAALIMAPDYAMADGIENALCKVVEWLTGPIGKAIATIAIIIIGVGALMGKVSWGMAIIVAIGVGVVFGASELVTALGGGDEACGGTA